MPTIATRQAAKFWIGLVGVVLTAVVASMPDAPVAVKVALAVSTALGVYLIPNAAAPLSDGDPEAGDE